MFVFQSNAQLVKSQPIDIVEGSGEQQQQEQDVVVVVEGSGDHDEQPSSSTTTVAVPMLEEIEQKYNSASGELQQQPNVPGNV